MKQSLTYYITLLIIKLKGLKKDFSKDPIDFKKIRKGDVHHPKGSFFRENILRRFKISDSIISEICRNKNSDKLLIFVHGGAFISGPSQVHWDVAKKIAKHTEHVIWLCDYPKAPENKITKISENIDSIYATALEHYLPNQISFIGDSVGATLITSLVQRLIIKNTALPHKIILISPVMDASMSNPEIEKADEKDPMLSKTGILSAKKMCAENKDLKNVMISPLFGSIEHFPETILFLAENDITYPDQKLAVQKLISTKVNLQIIEGKNMPHIWPFLPVMKEAKIALNKIIDEINK
ncbi:alpha/beta hydrolase fold domain-containing protein [Arcticibacterium luteifluviistationis]|uniref:Esterase n=1 Tax=Arcticibacterium luteifluviistationis TaxID=1784714 RepID=A0A2Z4G7N5_9BACT|nr:alpha/beta hydrolase [Arcticibacterium luteifluviistationis]AWV97157.1 esterase [Arcticibacterium luteifluviistationis]